MTTTNMSLNEPSVGQTAGPDWATEVNANFTTIDQHDHTSGKGVQLTPSALNINSDLEFNGNAAIELKRLTLDSSATGSGTNYSVYQSGGNLYWYNGSGQAVQITNGANVKTTGGSIDGMSGTDAQVLYGSGIYRFEFDTTLTPFSGSKMAHADILLYKYDGSSGSDAYVILKYTGSSAGSNNITVPDETGTMLTTSTSYGGNISIAATGGSNTITLNAANDINLTATADVNLPNNVGLVFGDDGEKIEGDGTDLTIASSGEINVNSGTLDLSAQTVDVTLNNAVDALNFDSNTLSIDASNNKLGVGTAAPDSKLHVEGNLSGSADALIEAKNTANSNHPCMQLINENTGGNSTDNHGLFIDNRGGTGASNSIRVKNNTTEVLTVKANGKVGIGTNDPDQNLDVLNTAQITGAEGTSASLYLIADGGDDNGDGWRINSNQDANDLTISNNTSGSYVDKVTILTTGNCGFGVTSPSRKVHAKSDANGNAGFFEHHTGSGTIMDIRFDSTGTPTDGSQYIRFGDANSNNGSITVNGASNVAFNTSSDYRLKENILPMTGAINRLNKLKPSRFNFIADPEKTMDGFIAHEVSDYVPESITGEKDAVDENGNINPQQIDQSKLVPLLVGAVQELSAKVSALENA